MAITVTHSKTDTIADWTQTELDAAIAAGQYPPGTVLADIVLPSDWNDEHVVAGAVEGPASATDNAIVRFDTTTGKLVKNSSAQVTDAGEILAGAGSAAAPSYSFSSDSNTGFYSAGADDLRISTGGNDRARLTTSALIISPSVPLFFAASGTATTNAPSLTYDNTSFALALRNGTNAQTYRVYGTYTDASNGDWLSFTKAAGGTATINTVANGTGTAGGLDLTGNPTRIQHSGSNRIATNSIGIAFTSAGGSAAATSRFSFVGSNDTSLTASTEAPFFLVNMAQTREHATGALALQRDCRISGSTHSFVGASTLTDAAALAVVYGNGGANATITNLSAILVQTAALTNATNGYGLNVAAPTGATNNWAALFSGNTQIANGGLALSTDVFLQRDAANTLALRNGTNAQTCRVYGTWTDASNGDWLNITKVAGGAATISTTSNGTGTAGNLVLSSSATSIVTIGSSITLNSGNNFVVQTASTTRINLGSSLVAFTPGTGSSASSVRFSFTGALDTSLTASTEATSVHFNIAQTRSHATGGITLQRDMRVSGSTHIFDAASVITDQAALSVEFGNGGTNATITNLSALLVQTRALSNTTNGYGINIAAPSGATNNWAARFAGNIQFASGSLVDPSLSVVAPTTTSVGYLGAPQNLGLDSADYTLVLSDSGKSIDKTTNTARILTIPANGSVAFPIGTILTGYNLGTGAVTMSITTDTLRWGSSTGSRTIAQYGSWTIRKITSTVWVLTGDGIT